MEDTQPKHHPLVIAGVGIVLLTLLVGFFWYRGRGEEPLAVADDAAGLGAGIFDDANNPVKGNLPDTNPFTPETNPFIAQANPFEVETNPLKSFYQNPFQ